MTTAAAGVGGEARMGRMGTLPLLLALAAALADACQLTDTEGDTWDMSFAAGIQQTRGPSTTGTYDVRAPTPPLPSAAATALTAVRGRQYEWDVCQNVNPVPSACQIGGVLGTAALRHEATFCAQLAPDINLNPAGTVLTKAGTGVVVSWSEPTSGLSFTLQIECATTAAPGLATEGNAPVVIWRHEGVCTAGPGPDIPPIDVIENYWGRTTLILMGVGLFLYIVGGTYYQQSQEGKTGTACLQDLGRDSFPPSHVAFWSGLPSLVRDVRSSTPPTTTTTQQPYPHAPPTTAHRRCWLVPPLPGSIAACVLAGRALLPRDGGRVAPVTPLPLPGALVRRPRG